MQLANKYLPKFLNYFLVVIVRDTYASSFCNRTFLLMGRGPNPIVTNFFANSMSTSSGNSLIVVVADEGKRCVSIV